MNNNSIYSNLLKGLVAEPINVPQNAVERISTTMANQTTYLLYNNTGLKDVSFSLRTPNLCIGDNTSLYNKVSITCAGSVSMRVNLKSILRLKSFLNYPDNWNGYGAKPFTAEYIKRVETLLVMLPFEADIFPLSDARVQFEFEKNNGAYLEFEVNPDKTVGVYELLPDRFEREYTATWEDIVRIVKDFYE